MKIATILILGITFCALNKETVSLKSEPVSIEDFIQMHTNAANGTDEVNIVDLWNTHPLSCSLGPEIDGTHSGIADESKRWIKTKGIFFQYDLAFSRAEIDTINSALFALSQVVCIPFWLWPQNAAPTGDYAFIRRGGPNSGCNSAVGRQGGRQIINLEATGCIHKTVITHETIHALGFFHEHTREDRDSFVNVFFQNIIPGLAFNFNIAKGTLTFGVGYDANSIMHYSSDAFSSNGLATILKKNGATIPYNFDLRQSDKDKLRRMYKC